MKKCFRTRLKKCFLQRLGISPASSSCRRTFVEEQAVFRVTSVQNRCYSEFKRSGWNQKMDRQRQYMREVVMLLILKVRKSPLSRRSKFQTIHNMNNARRIMHDYEDINAEATGKQLHELYIPYSRASCTSSSIPQSIWYG